MKKLGQILPKLVYAKKTSNKNKVNGKMKTEVCFVVTPNNWNSQHMPYYYMALSAWLEREGITNEIIDIKRKHDFLIYYDLTGKYKRYVFKRILDKLLFFRPRFVGIACFTTDYYDVMFLANEIKKVLDCIIIVGNAHATLKPDDLIYPGSPIDFVVVGEGELTLTELIKTIKSNGDVSMVSGIAYLKDGKFHFTGKRTLIEDLSVLPMFNYEKLDMDFYLKPKSDLIRRLMIRGVAIYTGRGCPYNCEFCASSTVWKMNDYSKKFVRHRPVQDVIKEIVYLKRKYDIDGFYIMDDTFTLNKNWVYEFCNELNKLNLNLIWGSETRVNLIDEDLIVAMKKAGCIQLDFGVESGSQDRLNDIKKGITVEKTREVFALCRKHGIRTFANMLINLPNETEHDIKLSEQLMDEIKADEYGFNITTPYIGTAIYEKYVNPKLTNKEYDIYNKSCEKLKERFKMAKHTLDLENILKNWNKKYGQRFYFAFRGNKKYWKHILLNKRFPYYLSLMFYETLKHMIFKVAKFLIKIEL